MANVEPGQRWHSPSGKLYHEIKSVHWGKHKNCSMGGDEPHVHYICDDRDDYDCLYHFGEYYTDPVPGQHSTGARAADWLRQVADRLVEKSKSYGDSVGDPVRIFSKAGTTEGIRVRIDDKLSRIARGREWPGEDVVVDLVGYLALLAVTEEPNV